jgi:hypothetical protein
MPYFQEYLTLSEEIHATLPFKIFYTLWYESWPKDLDEDYFKSIGQEVKKDEHEGWQEEHASSHAEEACIEEYQTTTYDTSSELTDEADDTSVLDGEDEDTTSCPTYDDYEKMFQSIDVKDSTSLPVYDVEDEDGSSGNSTLHPIYDMYDDADTIVL